MFSSLLFPSLYIRNNGIVGHGDKADHFTTSQFVVCGGGSETVWG
ncbi:TPA: hypothetical protein ACHWB5_000076 [Streptococcus suis]